MHNIILQTNILSIATEIPAIDNRFYTQTIDEEKDAALAYDDKRIPEELKDLAAKYLADNNRDAEKRKNGQTTKLITQLAKQMT